MTVVNQTTNGYCAGIHLPMGTTDFPLEGNIQIYATGWGPSNVIVGSSDTLFLYDEGYNLQSGYGLIEAWVLGFALGFVGLGTLGLVRRLGRMLHAPDAMDNM